MLDKKKNQIKKSRKVFVQSNPLENEIHCVTIINIGLSFWQQLSLFLNLLLSVQPF